MPQFSGGYESTAVAGGFLRASGAQIIIPSVNAQHLRQDHPYLCPSVCICG
jgi:hypothetical protein